MCPFLTAQSLDGEVFLFLFVHLSNCTLMVLSAASPALHRTHRHTHTNTQTDDGVWLPSSPASPSSLPFVWHHLFWVMWPCFSINCGHFGFELHIQCPFVYTTDALHKSDTQLGGNQRWNNLSSVTVFRPFLTWKKHNHGLHVVVFFVCLFVFIFSLLSLLMKIRCYFLKLPVIWN